MKLTPVSAHLPSIDEALLEQIRAEQLRMLMGNTVPMCLIASLFAVVLAFYASYHTDLNKVLWWIGLKLAVVVPRIVHALAFRWHPSRHAGGWQKWALGLILIDGICWGLAAPILTTNQDQEFITVIGCALMGVAAVATFNLHANWWANFAYCAPMVALGMLMMLRRADSYGIYAALSMGVFAVGLLTAARRAHKFTTELLWRRFSMDRVLMEKEAALRAAERNDAIKSQFVATMSHELRTPLHGILGLTRMLMNKLTAPDVLNQLGLVQRSGEHLLMLINHILDFSRIEAGYLHIDRKPFDLDALLADVVNLTSVSAQSKGLSLTASIQLPKPCWVEGDAPKVRQVLLNLIGNAIKFTEAGTINLRVSHEVSSGKITLTVADSGVGISPQDLLHIFAPYKQVNNMAGNTAGGTGLGLTISREISRAMHGDITCESTVGKGSVFTFTALMERTTPPAVDAPDPMRPPWADGLQRPALGPVKLNGHVLLAEDNDVNAMIVEAQLHRQGLTVEHVRDGQEALERLVRTDMLRPDLVLMDCQMPKLDGFEVTRRLRDFERKHGLSRLSIVALTASAMAEDNARCLRAGMDAHLPKPFDDEQLSTMLASYLSPAGQLSSTA